MEVDKKMGIDVYEQIPVMESEKFLLREIEDGDAEDLLKVYSDKDAVPLFNSDNCVNGIYYTSIEEMQDTIAFWKREYKNRYYVRWAIIDKNALLKDLDQELVKQENKVESIDEINGPQIILGSLEEVTLTGNWPKKYGNNE